MPAISVTSAPPAPRVSSRAVIPLGFPRVIPRDATPVATQPGSSRGSPCYVGPVALRCLVVVVLGAVLVALVVKLSVRNDDSGEATAPPQATGAWSLISC